MSLSIVEIDKKPVGPGRPGPVTARIRALFEAAANAEAAAASLFVSE